MGGIGDHGQVGELFEHRNGGDVHGVASRGLIGADAALAEDHLVVAAGEDVLARKEQLLDGGGDAALEQDGLADLAEFAEQVEVLHVARAHLETIHKRQHGLDLGDFHDLADGGQAVGAGGFAHELEAGNAEALKGVRRAARLECASAQKAAAGGFDRGGDSENLVAVFDGAGTGDESYLPVADDGAIGKLDFRALRAKGAAGQLVWGADAMHLEHARQNFKLAEVEAGGGSDRGQNGLHCAGGTVHVHTGFFHHFDDAVDLIFGSAFLHGDNHCLFPVSGVSAPAAWPGRRPSDWAAWAFLSLANSFLCRDRITSMMRS